MKKTVLLVLVTFLLGTQMASAKEITQVISCPLNKTYSLVISFLNSGERIDEVTMEARDFAGRNEEGVTSLHAPRMQLIQYGNVTIVSQNFGRSGYALIRLEQTSDTEYEGLLDINLFLNPISGMAGKGRLLSTTCFKIR